MEIDGKYTDCEVNGKAIFLSVYTDVLFYVYKPGVWEGGVVPF